MRCPFNDDHILGNIIGYVNYRKIYSHYCGLYKINKFLLKDFETECTIWRHIKPNNNLTIYNIYLKNYSISTPIGKEEIKFIPYKEQNLISFKLRQQSLSVEDIFLWAKKIKIIEDIECKLWQPYLQIIESYSIKEVNNLANRLQKLKTFI